MGIKSTRKRGFRWRILSFDPFSRVWIGWLGLFLTANNLVASLLVLFWAALGADDTSATIALLYGYLIVWFGIPGVVALTIVVFIIATAIILVASRSNRFVAVLLSSKVRTFILRRAQVVIEAYNQIPKYQRFLYLLMWLAIVAIGLYWVIPIGDAADPFPPVLNSPLSLQNAFFTVTVLLGYSRDFEGVWLNAGLIPSIFGIGFVLVLSPMQLIILLMATLRPTNFKLLKRGLYAFMLSLMSFVPFSIFVTRLTDIYLPTNFLPAQIQLMLSAYILLLIALPYLYSQRARLSALGGRVKRNMRFLAMGGVAMQLFFMVYWAVLTAPEAGVFYIASVVFAVFLALAWAVVLLLVGERTKRDWGLFALILAVQVASVVVTAPGVVSA